MGHSATLELSCNVIGIFISSAPEDFGSNKFMNGFKVPKT